jgi:hypothetical protein
LTIGGWFWLDALSAGGTGLIGKYDTTTNNRSYLLYTTNSPDFRFVISVDGTATKTVTSTTTPVARTWYHIVGRFDPSTEVKIWVNGSSNTNVAAVPAAIFNSTANLNCAALDNGAAATRLNGRASLNFLCAAALSDSIVLALYEQTRALFAT